MADLNLAAAETVAKSKLLLTLDKGQIIQQKALNTRAKAQAINDK